MKLFKTRRVNIHEQGLAKVVGTLEADILEFLWNLKTASARAVCDHLNRRKNISFNAVNTVLNRLVEKGMLKRLRAEGMFTFFPRYTRDELCRMVSEDIFTSLVRDKKLFSIAGFTEALENLSKTEKHELLEMLESKKKNISKK